MSDPRHEQGFAAVHNTYQHHPKHVRPAKLLQWPGVALKWHLVFPESLPISEAETLEAQAFLRQEIAAKKLGLDNETGFVVQHRTPEWMILYVCFWRNNNELWETLYHNHLTTKNGFVLFQRENTSPTFCVWVLSVVAHEQHAWSDYLQSARDKAAQNAYLNAHINASVF